MHSQFFDHSEKYDGSQLAPLTNYLRHGLLGDSIVSWVGPCDVKLDHMIDGEDLREEAAIKADSMLHLVLEIFNQDLYSGIFLQRIIGDHVRQLLLEMGEKSLAQTLERRGDDLYMNNKKLNISIATSSGNSFLIHFGINVSNSGTPVETCCLEDFKVDSAQEFALKLLDRIVKEVNGQKRAFCKVRTF